jgi:hypothetical protein
MVILSSEGRRLRSDGVYCLLGLRGLLLCVGGTSLLLAFYSQNREAVGLTLRSLAWLSLQARLCSSSLTSSKLSSPTRRLSSPTRVMCFVTLLESLRNSGYSSTKRFISAIESKVCVPCRFDAYCST